MGHAVGTTATGASPGRLFGLDALRGLCALSVLVFHLTTDYGSKFGWPTGEPAVFMPWASFAVRLFFVLSGFVIYFSLTNSGSLHGFAIARFARLYPAYIVACLMTLGVIFLGGYNPRDVALADIPANLTMMATLLGFNHIDAPYWTLQREVCFYFLVAFLFSMRRLVDFETLLCGWLIACVVANLTVASPSFYDIRSTVDRFAVVFAFQVVHLFVIGMVAFKLMTASWTAKTLVVAVVALLASGFSEWPNTHHFDWLTVAKTVGYGLTIMLAARVPIPETGLFAPLLWLGRISYAVYLVHETFGYFVMSICHQAGVSGTFSVLASIFCCLALGHFINSMVEEPGKRWILGLYNARKPLVHAKAGGQSG